MDVCLCFPYFHTRKRLEGPYTSVNMFSWGGISQLESVSAWNKVNKFLSKANHFDCFT